MSFAAVSAYGSWASRKPGDTTGSPGENAEFLASGAVSLRLLLPPGPSALLTCSEPFPVVDGGRTGQGESP